MNQLFMNNQVLIYLLMEGIIAVMLLIALYWAIKMLMNWNFGSFSTTQYRLEKRAYLVGTILLFSFIVKFFLLIYFVFTIDSISILIPGAMCAAGVVSANDYGMQLLLMKLLILFFMLLWMSINSYDMQAKSYPLFRFKQWIFLIIFVLVAIEGYLDIEYFTLIDIRQPVSCCSTLYGQLEGSNPLPLGLNIQNLMILFYMIYTLLMVTLWYRYRIVTIVLSILFVFISYYSVVYLFGTYVYRLPTHKCPFCMMQGEYYFVGYLLWGTLFIGSYQSIIASFINLYTKSDIRINERRAMVLLSIFVLVCSAYVSIYYLQNGVLL